MTRFAPSMRNSWGSLPSTSNSRFSRAEITIAPLTRARIATTSRPLLPRKSFQSKRQNISLAPQNRRRIEVRRAPQRNQTTHECHDCRDAKDHRKQNQPRRSGRAKHARAQAPCQCRAHYEPDGTSRNREQQLFREENPGDQRVGRTQRLHHADFRAPLKNGGSRRSSNRQGRSTQRRERNNPKQGAYA